MRSLRLLLAKELRALLASPSFWLLILSTALLGGFSFVQAVRLFAEAGRSLAQPLSALDGVFVPSLGSLYLASTLLYPFLAIRFISSEKESGALKLLLQLPVPFERVIAAKALALAAGWAVAAAVPVATVLLWAMRGGHPASWELSNLLLGHALYAFAIMGLAILSGSIADSASSAALLALAVVLGNWALDFAASTQTGWARAAGALSLTSCMREFEKGLFSSPQAVILVIVGLLGIATSAVWLRIGERPAQRARKASIFALAGILAGILFARFPYYKDVSLDRRNSFSEADQAKLSRLARPLVVKVYLNPDDSRLWDLERGVLSKLRRVVPKTRISLETADDDRYGLIIFEYGGRTDQTRSTSEEEIMPIIFSLAGTSKETQR